MKKLLSEGVGCQKKSAQAITPSKVEMFWETYQLGMHTPEALMNTIF